MRLFLVCIGLIATVACHPGQPMFGGDKLPVMGTISGNVTSESGSLALPSRKITVINVNTSTRYDATTSTIGGYTVRVPSGTYRFEVELRPGERLTKQPSQIRVHRGDIDARRDFVIGVGAAR